MPETKIEDLYKKTTGFSEGLERELNDTVEHNRFKVIQKHVRFHVLNTLVQKYGEHGVDLMYFILHNHHSGEELSQRDITKLLKDLWGRRKPNEKTSLIREAIYEIKRILEEITLMHYRDKIDMILKDKRELFDRALNDDFLDKLEEMMSSFDQKAIANFVAVFGLSMRGAKEKGKGRSCKKKLSQLRSARNGQMWSDPEARQTLCDAMKKVWDERKNGNGNQQETT